MLETWFNKLMSVNDRSWQLGVTALALISTWLLAQTVLSGLFEAAAVYEGYYRSFRYEDFLGHLSMTSVPSTWPSVDVKSHTYDFSVLFEISKNLNVVQAKPVILPENILPYGPMAFLFYSSLDFIVGNHKGALFIHQILAVSTFLFSVGYGMKQNFDLISVCVFLFVVTFCSTILQIFIFSGNIEVFLFSLSCLGVLFSQKYKLLAASFLCVAASVKYYPAIFLLLFLKDGQFRIFFYSVGLSALLIFLPYILLEGTLFQNIFFTLEELRKSSTLCEVAPENFCTYGGLSIANIVFNLPISQDTMPLLYRIISICLFS